MTSCSLPKKHLEGKVGVKVVYVRTLSLFPSVLYDTIMSATL